MRDDRVKSLAFGGATAAIVFLMTYFFKIPVSITNGYVHLGDGAVFLAAMVLGPGGVAAAAVGSALADLVGGYAVYILPTFLIKGAMALIVWKGYREKRMLSNVLLFALAEAVMLGGYLVLEGFLYGWAPALASLGPNAVQGAAGVVLGAAFSLIAPRLKKTL